MSRPMNPANKRAYTAVSRVAPNLGRFTVEEVRKAAKQGKAPVRHAVNRMLRNEEIRVVDTQAQEGRGRPMNVYEVVQSEQSEESE